MSTCTIYAYADENLLEYPRSVKVIRKTQYFPQTKERKKKHCKEYNLCSWHTRTCSTMYTYSNSYVYVKIWRWNSNKSKLNRFLECIPKTDLFNCTEIYCRRFSVWTVYLHVQWQLNGRELVVSWILIECCSCIPLERHKELLSI